MANNIVTPEDLKVVPCDIEHLIVGYVKQMLRFGDINAKKKEKIHKIITKIDYNAWGIHLVGWLKYKNHMPKQVLFERHLNNSFGYPYYGKAFKLNQNHDLWISRETKGIEDIIIDDGDWDSCDN